MEETETITRGKPGRKSRAEQAAAMTASPQFQEAVNTAVQAAIGPLMMQLEAARAIAGTANQSVDKGLMADLAMSIAELTTQGTGRVKVSPEVMRMRQDAREKMVNLIIEARAKGTDPHYTLRNKITMNEGWVGGVYRGDRLVEPFYQGQDKLAHPTIICSYDIPNDAMVPHNDVAKEIFAAYRESVGNVVGHSKAANQLPPEDKLGATPGGRIVRNGAITNAVQRATPERPQWEDGKMPAYEEEQQPHKPSVLHESHGPEKRINVLGTLMPAAKRAMV